MRRSALITFLFAAILAMGVVTPGNADEYCEDTNHPQYDATDCGKQKVDRWGATSWAPKFIGHKIPISRSFKIELTPGYQSRCERIQKTDVAGGTSATRTEFENYSVHSDMQGKRLDITYEDTQFNLKIKVISVIDHKDNIIDLKFDTDLSRMTSVNKQKIDVAKIREFKEKIGPLIKSATNYHLNFSGITIRDGESFHIKGHEKLFVMMIKSMGMPLELVSNQKNLYASGFAEKSERIVYVIEGTGNFEVSSKGEVLELQWGGYFLVNIDSGQIVEIHTKLKTNIPNGKGFQQTVKKSCEITGPNITAGKIAAIQTAKYSDLSGQRHFSVRQEVSIHAGQLRSPH